MPQMQTQVTVSGLNLQQNPLGEIPPGSLQVANNCVSRRKGVISPLPGNSQYAVYPADSTRAVKAFSVDSYMYTIHKPNGSSSANRLRYIDVLFSPTDWTSVTHGTTSRNFVFNPGQTHHASLRGRHFFTESTSPIVIDAGGFNPRLAGLPPPGWIYLFFAAPTTDPAIISASNYVAYRAYFRRRSASTGYTVVGAVSPVCARQNGTGVTATTTLQVYFNKITDPIVAGDEVVYARVLQKASIAELGDNFIEVGSYTITNTDITNGYCTIVDKVQDDNLVGAALYTNEFQEGEDRSNYMPPPAVDVAAFRGAMFYAQKSAWSALSIAVSGQFGTLSGSATDQKNGIGIRLFNGDITSGSNTITNCTIGGNYGLAVGQEIYQTVGAAIFPATTYITNITGAGPYTVTVSQNSNATAVGKGLASADVLTVVQGSNTSKISIGAGLFTGLRLMTAGLDVRLFPESVVDMSASLSTGVSFTLQTGVSGSPAFTVSATNGANYYPDLSSTVSAVQDTRKNRIWFSKIQQPEAVAPVNYLDVGAETILKMWPTMSALYVFCTDGIFRITGDGDDWDVQPVNPTTILLHPDCVDSMDNNIFAWTNDGLTILTDAGTDSLSAPFVGDALRDQWATYVTLGGDSGMTTFFGPSVACYDKRKEVWLNFNYVDNTTSASDHFYKTYIFNTETAAWTTQDETSIYAIGYFDSKTTLFYTTATQPYIPSTTTWANARVVFNPFTAGDSGPLKQWIDAELYFENLAFSTGTTGTIEPVWSTTIPSGTYARSVTASSGRRIHAWIPRTYASNDQVVTGFAFSGSARTNFDFYGVRLRYRIASETLNR